jgi:phosphoribosylanthranilate isomerase
MTRIKICGITNRDDAEAAVAAGADALGFNFAQSPRRVSAEQAAAIMSDLSPFVAGVGVFVDMPAEQVRETLQVSGCSVAQLHGNEDRAYIEALSPLPVIKAVRIAGSLDDHQLDEYKRARAILLDTYVAGQQGGTGERFDPAIAARLVKAGLRVIVAGGLAPDNVAEVVAQVRPHGVDVSSGVEIRPGRKDHAKMQQFVTAVRAAEEGG